LQTTASDTEERQFHDDDDVTAVEKRNAAGDRQAESTTQQRAGVTNFVNSENPTDDMHRLTRRSSTGKYQVHTNNEAKLIQR
jgi:hypothetical protein